MKYKGGASNSGICCCTNMNRSRFFRGGAIVDDERRRRRSLPALALTALAALSDISDPRAPLILPYGEGLHVTCSSLPKRSELYRKPFLDPVTIVACFHTFCRTCLWETFLDSDYPRCPVDLRLLSTRNVSPAHPMLCSLVDGLYVECPHRPYGCRKRMARRHLSAHLQNECVHTPYTCDFPGCGATVPLVDMLDHQIAHQFQFRGDPVDFSGTGRESFIEPRDGRVDSGGSVKSASATMTPAIAASRQIYVVIDLADLQD
ncbi:hypothetical protein CC1G_03190 [Coprinopsis cinerea okayama7|uniref:RING-type domain-containing protein n=1 Tax=Coprinopsis cinerea (strain Okayama-7 / 130 / ATCC MYA-4618 / FGSC 9003) TaxID=240176 RepID=A8N747_COPC7|nr:hypothetical protein CC1G_03190 [Coprinopsis cinerea okayama7\|eukprot:XP_001830653.2 hypothetical protein CC1G_03190 [Coprinopsis cinerea okayama7\